MNRGERRLVSLAVALIGKTQALSSPETKLVAFSRPVAPSEVARTREQILAGHDPLGTEFCLLRSAKQRRPYGATYTPPSIVAAMSAWAGAEISTPARVVDPGCGSGRYLVAAARNFPRAQLIGVEIDPLAALMLRANAAVHGFENRLTLHLADYRSLVLPPVSGSTLFIGNPPYVRHHDIAEEWKAWFASTASRFGVRASKLAGLHIHFFVKTRELARPGDFGAFITAAEWLDVNYGSTLRCMLADGLGGTALHVIRPEAQAFEDALTTSAITCFRVGSRPKQISMRSVGSLDELAPLRRGRAVDVTDAVCAPKWSVFLRERTQKPAGFIELGELFRVHRGQVTGNNSVWIDGEASQEVPRRYKPFTVTKARELIVADTTLTSNRGLRRVVDLPADLDALDEEERKTVQRFLAWARQQAAHEGYVARHRRAWWSVGLRAPAPILCTYMGRRPPAFVRNRADARHINIAHGLYPREPISESMFAATLAYLRRHVSVAEGRTYAGGLVKFEPREIERIVMPQPGDIHAYLVQSEESPRTLDRGGAAGRRRRGEEQIS
ncbi:MAG TPA: N-6 DNA methylase [Rhizomicrobium sp.]|nr:N-6 DNA methylase [Rhizomicrobium sp.]